MSWSTGAGFFHPDYGLKVGKLADAVRDLGPVLVDTDDRLWVYADGVWRVDAGEIRRRAVRLLGERCRDTHLRSLATALRGSGEVFDVQPQPRWLNLPNGMLTWQRDPDPDLVDHHPEFMSTVRLPVRWNPLAGCPEFDAFLESSVPADDLLRAWQLLGYLLVSGNPLQRLFMLTGTGGNGKGVYLNVIRALLGHANFAAVPLQDFSESRFATSELFGKLANVCGDIDATFIQNTGRIKELSGDDVMKGERKGEHPFYFTFWGKAIFSANAIPGAADSSRGWLRRWEVIQFPYTPPKADADLSDRVTSPEELEGILVKAVYALRDLMEAKEFCRGESAENAHAEFAEKANRVIRWIADDDSNVSRDDDTFCKGTILLAAFREWEAEDSGHDRNPTGAQKFHELARQAGLRETKLRGQRGFWGLKVTRMVFIKERDKPWLNYQKGGSGNAPIGPTADEPEQLQML